METESSLKQWSNAYNEGTKNKHLINEVYRSFWNHRTITDGFAEGWAKDLGKASKCSPKDPTPCLVIGSGPTLDDALPLLKDWEGGIICSTSHATTLLAFGAEPDYIVALDPDSNAGEINGVNTWDGRKSALVCHPGVCCDLIEYWKGRPMYLFRQNVRTSHFYSNAQMIGYAVEDLEKPGTFNVLIETLITMFSCAATAMIFLARLLEYSPIILLGLDFSMPGRKTRFTSWSWTDPGKPEPDGIWREHKPKTIDETYVDGREAMLMETNTGIPTDTTQMFYKKNFIASWALDRANLINVGEGALVELPNADLDRVIRKQGRGLKGFHKRKITEIAENYLATQALYIIDAPDGKVFLEAEHPHREIPEFIERYNETRTCKKCGWSGFMKVKDEVPEAERPDLDKVPCPKCGGENTLGKKAAIDLNANMRKVTKRIAYAEKHQGSGEDLTGKPISPDGEQPGNASMLATNEPLTATVTKETAKIPTDEQPGPEDEK